MKPVGRRMLFVLAWLHAPIAAAQSGPQAGKPDDVVVVGRKDRDRAEQIRDFVRGLTMTHTRDPLARFDQEKLCPRAVGLTASADDAVTTRMRRVAEAAKMPLAKADCRYPNVLVLFADDKAAMVAALRKRYPGLFNGPYREPLRIPDEKGPAVAWQVKGLVSREGALLMPGDDGVLTLATISPPSRLQAMTRSVFLMSIVVIERRGVEGLTATQVADYAAMRAYTGAKPENATGGGAPTILAVLDAPMGSETPPSMTAWDLNFLRGYYSVQRSTFSSSQRGEIGTYMKRELDKADGSGG